MADLGARGIVEGKTTRRLAPPALPRTPTFLSLRASQSISRLAAGGVLLEIAASLSLLPPPPPSPSGRGGGRQAARSLAEQTACGSEAGRSGGGETDAVALHEAECRARLRVSDSTLDAQHVRIEVADGVCVLEEKRFRAVEANGEDVARVRVREPRIVFERPALPEKLLVVCQLDDDLAPTRLSDARGPARRTSCAWFEAGR